MPPTRLLIRFCFRVTLPCVLLLSVAILLVHGLSSSASSISALLLPPPGCSAPCFLGIQPGQATLDAGLDQLRASPFIQSISAIASPPGSPEPSGLYDIEFVPTRAPLRSAQMQFVTEAGTGIIESIHLMNTGLQLSDIALTFGQPRALILDNMFRTSLVTYAAFYPQYQMYIQAVLPVCSPEEDLFWNRQQSILIGIETAQKYNQQRSYYPTEADQTEEGWRQQLHDLERSSCT